MEDEHYFSKLKTGDYSSFEVLFRRHYQPMVSFAFSIVRNDVIAEEIAQEVFIYVWEKKSKIELSGKFTSYLSTAIRNKCINYIRLELPKQQASTGLEDVHMAIAPRTDDTKALQTKIQHAINQLPPKCRHIFTLSRYGGMTYQEIAGEMDLSLKTIENQMGIALKKLKELLKDELN